MLYPAPPPSSPRQTSYGFSPIRQRQRHPRPQPLRLVYRHDHFQRRSPVLAAGTGPHRAILLNGLDQFPHNDQIALVRALARRVLFPLVQQHPFPSAVFLAGDPHALAIDVHLAVGRVAQGDDALTAVRLKAEPTAVVPFWIARLRFKMRGHPIRKNVVRRHPVAGDQANALVPFPHIVQRRPRAHPA